jgi:hypothetical protein
MNIYMKPDPDARGVEWPWLEDLETVADWREDLTMRIRRARLRQDFDGVNPEEIIALSAETQDFKRLVQALKGVIK